MYPASELTQISAIALLDLSSALTERRIVSVASISDCGLNFSFVRPTFRKLTVQKILVSRRSRKILRT